MSASSSSPWIVPSSPNVPCSTGKITSTLMARSEARRSIAASVWNGISPFWRCTGSGGTTTASPRASTAAGCVISGSPARRLRGSKVSLPVSRFSACSAVSHRPSFVMPMGTTSYLSLSIALRTEAAESSDTSCSPLRPPNKMPTRSFSMTIQCGREERIPSIAGMVRGANPATDSRGFPRINLCLFLIRGNPRRSVAVRLSGGLLSLKNLLPESRQRQLYRQIGGAIVFVDDGIHFDDFEAQHAAVIGNDFHGEVRFAVSSAAADRSAHAGRILRIDPVHVERNVVPGGAAPSQSQRLFHDGAHAALVDVAHREDADAS